MVLHIMYGIIKRVKKKREEKAKFPKEDTGAKPGRGMLRDHLIW